MTREQQPRKQGCNMYDLDRFMAELEARNPGQPEYVQAVHEVVEAVIEVVNKSPAYLKGRILERITEPDRTHMFRVSSAPMKVRQ